MAALKINIEKVGTHTVFIPKESITHDNCESLDTLFKETLEQGQREIILSGRALSFMDSAALELLLKVHNELKARSGVLKFIEMDEVCRDILIATGLINVLFIYENINQAVKSE